MISIVIPIYNQEEYLADAIESALHQNFEYDYEIVLVDDGSTDHSFDIARKFAAEDPLKFQLIHQTNRGLASARNTGILNAMGSWILPLDADDMLLDHALKRVEEEIKKTDADVIGLSLKTFGTSAEQIILQPNPTLEDFRSGNRLGYCSAIKKTVLLECGGYSPKMAEGYEDLHLWIDLLVRGKKIISIPEVLWLYRTKPESMWTKITPEIHNKLLDQINKDMPNAQLNFKR